MQCEPYVSDLLALLLWNLMGRSAFNSCTNLRCVLHMQNESLAALLARLEAVWAWCSNPEPNQGFCIHVE